MNEIRILDIQNQKVIGMRNNGKYKDLIPSLPQQLFKHIMKNDKEVCCDPPMIICHESCVEEVMEADKKGTADVEVAISIIKDIEQTDNMKIYILPGRKMAKIIHKGSYENIDHSYEKLFTWIKENNKSITGSTHEVYLNNPNEVVIEETLTEIYAPI